MPYLPYWFQHPWVDDISTAYRQYKHSLWAYFTHKVSALTCGACTYVYKLLHTYVPCT